MNAPLSLVSVKIMRASSRSVRQWHRLLAAMSDRLGVPQVLAQHTAREQSLDMADSLVSRPFELREQQVRVAVCPVQLLGAAARVVLRLECGQDTLDLFEAHSIGPRVR